MQGYQRTSSENFVTFENTNRLLYYIDKQREAFQPYSDLFQRLTNCQDNIKKEEYLGYGIKDDIQYKSSGIVRFLVILSAIVGGCIVLDNLVLNPILLFFSGTTITISIVIQYGSKIITALIFFVPLLLYLKSKRRQDGQLHSRKKEAANICSILYEVYESNNRKNSGTFVFPFEYSDPKVLSRLYNVASQYQLKTVQDTINIYEKKVCEEQWNALEQEAKEFEEQTRRMLRNYALIQMVSPSKVNVHVH